MRIAGSEELGAWSNDETNFSLERAETTNLKLFNKHYKVRLLLDFMKEKIIVSKDGPYLIEGDVPIHDEIVVNDKEGNPLNYQVGKEYPKKDSCALCRCGKSKNKPFCDGSHAGFFNGKETADNSKYLDSCEKISGPQVDLLDNAKLCSGVGFCHRKGGTWDLVSHSDDKNKKNLAICQCGNCPSGRLVAVDKKTGKAIEPKFEKSIGLIEHFDDGISGPIWVKGGIEINSFNGKKYETRNRVTLCRCGKSKNKPFCDGSHIQEEFNSKD